MRQEIGGITMFFIDESERVYSKVETIGVLELRQLTAAINTLGRVLTPSEETK